MRLRIVTSEGKAFEVAVPGEQARLGRHVSCEVPFDSTEFPMVSTEHARLERTGADLVLTPLSRSNKTLLNDQPLEGPTKVKKGDRIRLGYTGPLVEIVALAVPQQPEKVPQPTSKPQQAKKVGQPPERKAASAPAGLARRRKGALWASVAGAVVILAVVVFVLTRSESPSPSPVSATDAGPSQSPEAKVKKQAAASHEQIPPVTALVLTLKDGPGSKKKDALQQLGRLGAQARPALAAVLDILSDADPGIRKSAEDALARMGPSVKDDVPIYAAVLRAGSPQARAYAAGRLAELGQGAKTELAFLRVLSRDKDERLQDAAGKAVRRIEADLLKGLIKDLQDSSASVRGQAARELADMGPGAKPALPALVERLADSNKAVRLAVLEALVAVGPDAVVVLGDALRDKNQQVRLSALNALGRMGANARTVLPDLIAVLLADPDGEVREATLATFTRIGDVAIPHLTQALEREKNAERQKTLVDALASMGRDARPVLKKASEAAKPEVDKPAVAKATSKVLPKVAAPAPRAQGPPASDFYPSDTMMAGPIQVNIMVDKFGDTPAGLQPARLLLLTPKRMVCSSMDGIDSKAVRPRPDRVRWVEEIGGQKRRWECKSEWFSGPSGKLPEVMKQTDSSSRPIDEKVYAVYTLTRLYQTAESYARNLDAPGLRGVQDRAEALAARAAKAGLGTEIEEAFTKVVDFGRDIQAASRKIQEINEERRKKMAAARERSNLERVESKLKQEFERSNLKDAAGLKALGTVVALSSSPRIYRGRYWSGVAWSSNARAGADIYMKGMRAAAAAQGAFTQAALTDARARYELESAKAILNDEAFKLVAEQQALLDKRRAQADDRLEQLARTLDLPKAVSSRGMRAAMERARDYTGLIGVIREIAAQYRLRQTNPWADAEVATLSAYVPAANKPAIADLMMGFARDCIAAVESIPPGPEYDADRCHILCSAASLAATAAEMEHGETSFKDAFHPYAAQALHLLAMAERFGSISYNDAARDAKLIALAVAGRTDEAIQQGVEMQSIRENAPKYHFLMARLYAVKGRIIECADHAAQTVGVGLINDLRKSRDINDMFVGLPKQKDIFDKKVAPAVSARLKIQTGPTKITLFVENVSAFELTKVKIELRQRGRTIKRLETPALPQGDQLEQEIDSLSSLDSLTIDVESEQGRVRNRPVQLQR